jgi:putative acetyltransferase
MLSIRDERPGDVPSVHEINARAFPTEYEANLVDALREEASPVISLVAVDDETVVGHIMFTPVALGGNSSLRIMGLAPMAVVPHRQHRGIGSQLVKNGLQQCEVINFEAAVVLGHPDYYSRFGFVPASTRGIDCEYDVPDESFMILELKEESLAGIEGTISYHDAFRRAL